MAYRKLKATAGIFNGTRIVKDEVLVVDGQGCVQAMLPDHEVEDVQTLSGLLMPGMVNAHCHLELSHMKGRIPEGTGLVDFVFKVVTERHHDSSEINGAIYAAEEEMRGNGIVAAGDICNNASTLLQKKKGRLAYYNFIEVSGWAPAIARQRFDHAKALEKEFAELQAPRSLSPHAPYSVSDALWELMQPHFKGRTVTIHNQEAPFEDELFLEATGDFIRMYHQMKIDNTHFRPTKKTSLQSCYSKLQGAKNVLFVHNSFTKEEDLQFVMKTASPHAPAAFFCLCPNANRYIENVLPPLMLMRENRCTLVLGTDSLASNHALDILGEIRTLRTNFPSVPLEEMLQWATLNGARALRMEEKLGSFEKGKSPGLVLIDENKLRVTELL